MAGRGPAPKDANKRARQNKDIIPTTVLPPVGIVPQPSLPALPDGSSWSPATIDWWDKWGRSPQALGGLFGESDWSFLADTALLHNAVWAGDLKYMGELRLREAKLGATVEDRARLRLAYADAESAERKVEKERTKARSRDRRANDNTVTITVEPDEPDAD